MCSENERCCHLLGGGKKVRRTFAAMRKIRAFDPQQMGLWFSGIILP